MTEQRNPLQDASRAYGYFMAGLGIPLIVLIYILHRWREVSQDL